MGRKFFLFVMIVLFLGGNVFAQDFGFGFGDDSDSPAGGGSALSVTVGGDISASLLMYPNDFSDGADQVSLGDIFSGSLNFSAGTSVADAFLSLNLEPTATPVSVDEAYVRAYFGSLDVEAGIRKLNWGKADSLGPLDVINPLDYSELTDFSNTMNFKIARPLVHLSYRIGSFSKIEGVFVPWFEPLRYATKGRWVPSQMIRLDTQLQQLREQVKPLGVTIGDPNRPNITMLDYAQGGMRFTTTVGPADLGVQYYYGRLTRPSVTVSYTQMTINVPLPVSVAVPTAINFAYNPYHQIGIDWAQVLFGFNIRAEFAANITEDLDGDDGAVYNPHIAWSFGFDRDLVWGINLNLQCNETIRLLDDKIANDPLLDIEADTDMTSTQIIAALSRKFFMDKLEVRLAVFWEVEAGDFMFIPSLAWTNDALSIELSGGIFGGDKEGQFGQYKDNSFIKAVMTYSF